MTKVIKEISYIGTWNCSIMNSGQQEGPPEYNKKVVMILLGATLIDSIVITSHKLSTALPVWLINQNRPSRIIKSWKIIWT